MYGLTSFLRNQGDNFDKEDFALKTDDDKVTTE